MKRIVAIIVCLLSVFSFSVCANADEYHYNYVPSTAAPWKIIDSMSVTFYVSSNGKANVTYFVSSYSSAVEVTVYVEKKTSLFGWTQVGETENVSTSKTYISGSYSVPVDGSGEYRAVVIGAPESEKVKSIVYFTYDENVLLGDANSDGKINAFDARLVLRISARLQECTVKQLEICDIDCNKKLTAADARFVLRMAARLD